MRTKPPSSCLTKPIKERTITITQILPHGSQFDPLVSLRYAMGTTTRTCSPLPPPSSCSYTGKQKVHSISVINENDLYRFQIHAKFKFKMSISVDVGSVCRGTTQTISSMTNATAVSKRDSRQKQMQILESRNIPCIADAEVGTFCREGRLTEALAALGFLDQQGIQVSPKTYASLLQACTDGDALAEGKRVHAHMNMSGMEQSVYFGTKLVSMYTKCGSIGEARKVFDKMPLRNVFSWSAMIGGYVKEGSYEEALTLYYAMQREGVQSDNFVFPKVLKACAHLAALQQGKEIHDNIIRRGFGSYVYVGNALIDMYCKCGSLGYACKVFDKMSQRDEVSWNAMIAGYAQGGHGDEALKLFSQMQSAGMQPNLITWNVVIAGYAQGGNSDEAFTVFRQMQKAAGITPDVFTWTAMISGYTQNGHDDEALELFGQMQLAGVKPNSVTVASALSACAHSTAMRRGKEIHVYAVKSGFESDVLVGNALMAMYGRCGNVENARAVFDKLSQRDVISWNTMIAGYTQAGHCDAAFELFNQMQFGSAHRNVITWNAIIAGYVQNGHCDQALKLFNQMELDGIKRNTISWNTLIGGNAQNGDGDMSLKIFRQMQIAGVKSNSITLLGVLTACTHMAALQRGKEIHNYIVCAGFECDVFVANGLMDMYAKCGSIEDAQQVFDQMSQRDAVSWNVMVAGYGLHGHGEDAIELFCQMQQAGVKPDHITFTGVLSACSHAGLLDEGWKFFHCMTRDFNIRPSMEHHVCMVDLLGRSGCLDEAYEFINNMPLEPNASVWGALLGACRIHCNIEIGQLAAEHLFELQPGNAGNYVLLSNIYAAYGRWDDATMVRNLMKEKGVIKPPGCSWIEIQNKVHAFLQGDLSHPQMEEIYATLDCLAGQIKKEGYVPDTKFVLRDVGEGERE